MPNLKVGVVGLGWVAGAHIETFKQIEGVEVVAIHSRRSLNEAELSNQFGIPLKVYNDYDAMLKDASLDIIDICTPHPFHAAQAIAAANAGKHIYLEKPIALSYKDALAVSQAIEKAGVRSCVGFELRFSGQGVAIRSMIEQGLLGTVHYGEVDYYHGIGPWYGQFPWNIKKDMGGSSLLTAGVHALDTLLWFMDGEVEEVTSYSCKSDNEIFSSYEYDTTSVSLLKFKDGRIGKIASVIDCLQPYYFHINLTGSKGSMLDNKFYSSQLKGTSKDRWSELGVPMIDSGDVDDHPYKPQFASFVESIRNKKDMALTDFKTALVTHKVAYAADLSAQEGHPVKLANLDK